VAPSQTSVAIVSQREAFGVDGVRERSGDCPPRFLSLPEPQNCRGADGLALPQTAVAIVSLRDGG
jgi:hypothetical protein